MRSRWLLIASALVAAALSGCETMPGEQGSPYIASIQSSATFYDQSISGKARRQVIATLSKPSTPVYARVAIRDWRTREALVLPDEAMYPWIDFLKGRALRTDVRPGNRGDRGFYLIYNHFVDAPSQQTRGELDAFFNDGKKFSLLASLSGSITTVCPNAEFKHLLLASGLSAIMRAFLQAGADQDDEYTMSQVWSPEPAARANELLACSGTLGEKSPFNWRRGQ